MDNFLKSVNELNQKYNDIYITYFLYRIWMKNKDLVIYTLNRTEYNKILELLSIPENYWGLDMVFPLNNYMRMENKQALDTAFINHITQIDIKMKEFSAVNPEEVPVKKMYDTMMEFINENANISKMEKTILQFKKKINLQYTNIIIDELTA